LEKSCRGAQPNVAHEALAGWEENGMHICVLTQNVDGLHERAGSKGVIPIHGTLRNILCTACMATQEVENYEGLSPLPLCDHCNGILRPQVVLFGEALPQREVSRLYREMALGFDGVISIGTSSVFPYIAAPMRYAREWGALAVEVNPEITEVSPYADLRFPLRSVAFFERLNRDINWN
jgi:NAD-dependent deacetylase